MDFFFRVLKTTPVYNYVHNSVKECKVLALQMQNPPLPACKDCLAGKLPQDSPTMESNVCFPNVACSLFGGSEAVFSVHFYAQLSFLFYQKSPQTMCMMIQNKLLKLNLMSCSAQSLQSEAFTVC